MRSEEQEVGSRQSVVGSLQLVVGSEEEVGSRSFLENDKFGVTYFSKVSFTLEKLRSVYNDKWLV